jgi:hypothetical protein
VGRIGTANGTKGQLRSIIHAQTIRSTLAIGGSEACNVAEAEGAKESEEEHRGALMRDMQGTAVEKLAMFEKLRARGAFEGVDRRELMKLENMLRTFAAMEKV